MHSLGWRKSCVVVCRGKEVHREAKPRMTDGRGKEGSHEGGGQGTKEYGGITVPKA